MLKKFTILCFFLLLISGVFSLTISPASAKILKKNNVLELAIINTEDSELNVSIDLGNFAGAAVVSKTDISIQPRGNSIASIVFYDNVCRKGNICVVTSAGGSGGAQQVGTAIKVCMSAEVVTTASGVQDNTCGEAKITPEVVQSLISQYEASKKRLLSKIDFLKFACVEFSKASQFQKLLDDGDSKLSEAKSAMTAEQLPLAQTLVFQASDFLESAEKLIPSATEVFSDTKEYIFSESEIIDYLKKLGITNEQILSEAAELSKKLKGGRGTRAFRVINKIDGTDYFVVNVNLELVNITPNPISGVRLAEFFSPKIVNSVSGISTKTPFLVIRDFPLAVQFDFPDIQANSSERISYCINKEISKDNMEFFVSPIATYSKIPTLARGACTADGDCDDLNPCTLDKCSSGACGSESAADGTACGDSKQCISGKCAAAGEKPPAGQQGFALPTELLLMLVGVGILLLLAVVIFLLLRKKRTKEELKGTKEEPKEEMKEELKGTKEEMKEELKKEMKEELKKEMKEELKKEMKKK